MTAHQLARKTIPTRRASTAHIIHADHPERPHFAVGFGQALFLGTLGLIALTAFQDAPIILLVTLVLLPAVIGLLTLRSISDAVTIAWLSEMCFGGAGQWLTIGPVPIRWALLLITIVTGIASAMGTSRHAWRESRLEGPRLTTPPTILFYGAVYPLWLVAYAVLACNSAFWAALSDISFMFILLCYVALRSILVRHSEYSRGWFLGMTVVLALLFLVLAFAPQATSLRISDALLAGLPKLDRFGVTQSGISRTSLLTQALLLPGLYYGLLTWLSGSGLKISARHILGILLVLVAISSYVLFYLRGLLISISAVALLFAIGSLLLSRDGTTGLRLVLLCLLLVASIVTVYVGLIPEALERFARLGQGIDVALGASRVSQAGVLWQKILERPFLGHGLGTALYATGQRTTELQYHMLAYWLGALNLLPLLPPVIWLCTCVPRISNRSKVGAFVERGRLRNAFLCSAVTLLIAGATNPYLTSPYPVLFAVAYFAMGKAGVSSESSDRSLGRPTHRRC